MSADMRQTVSASGIARDYCRRDILPDERHQVRQGVLELWIWNNMFVARLMQGDVELTSAFAYRNVTTPQAIADDIIEQVGGQDVINQVHLMPSQAAAYLGSIKSERKAKSSAANGRKGGRPRKDK